MDVPTLIRKVQRLFGDDAQILISNTDLIDWINDAQLQIVRETNCLTATHNAAASTFPIATPASFMRAFRILYGNLTLQPTTLEDLDSKNHDLSYFTGSPAFYYIFANQIFLFPDPLSSDTTTVTIQYSKYPDTVSLTTDPLTVPVIYHEDIVRFCLARAHERNENYRAYEINMNEFLTRIGQRIHEHDVQDDTYTVIRDDPHFWSYP